MKDKEALRAVDVIVIGAGPGGATAATLLQQEGFRVLMLDRGQQPNAHLPESWIFSSQELFDKLGIDHISSAFLDKTKAQFFSASGAYGLRITLEGLSRNGKHPLVRLDRIKFDNILVNNAIDHGVHYAPHHNVVNIEQRNGSITAIVCNTPNGTKRFTAQFIIDASGKSAILANDLNLKEKISKLDPRVAVFSHFVGCASHELSLPNSMSIVGIEHGYVFVIPITSERVSIGVVIGEKAASAYQGDLDSLFKTELQRATVLEELLNGAQQVLPVIPALNDSYVCKRVSGPSYVLVGDAAAFLDPFYSNGIDIALESGVLAANTVAHILRSDSFEEHKELSDSYDSAFRALLQSKADGVYDNFAQGIERKIWTICADPHLPTLLPLAALMPHLRRHSSLSVDTDNPKAVIQAARQQFALL